MNFDSKYRYERKFLANNLTQKQVETIITLHPAMFSESFVSRHVNSLYLDTLNLNNYNDAVLGNNNRIKIRIRWYGELTGLIKKPMLEIKIKKSFFVKPEKENIKEK